MRVLLIITMLLSLSACANFNFKFEEPEEPAPIDTAIEKVGWNEHQNRIEIKHFTGVDPVSTQWCAAFVNAVLAESGLPGSDAYEENPLLARSFLSWGNEVEYPEYGDIVVFSRGRESWKGHVGFYVGSTYVDGQKHYLVLGGNQNNSVTYKEYPARRLLSIRRFSIEG